MKRLGRHARPLCDVAFGVVIGDPDPGQHAHGVGKGQAALPGQDFRLRGLLPGEFQTFAVDLDLLTAQPDQRLRAGEQRRDLFVTERLSFQNHVNLELAIGATGATGRSTRSPSASTRASPTTSASPPTPPANSPARSRAPPRPSPRWPPSPISMVTSRGAAPCATDSSRHSRPAASPSATAASPTASAGRSRRPWRPSATLAACRT